MYTNFDRLDRHTEGQKTYRRYVNTQETNVQTDNICSVWMMHTAARFFVYLFVSDVCSNVSF